jgi:hypothetical protein
MSISVSENQYLAIFNAAAALCPSDRDQFVASVARELEGKPVGDGAVARAIAGAFRTFFHPPEEASNPPSRWNRAG